MRMNIGMKSIATLLLTISLILPAGQALSRPANDALESTWLNPIKDLLSTLLLGIQATVRSTQEASADKPYLSDNESSTQDAEVEIAEPEPPQNELGGTPDPYG